MKFKVIEERENPLLERKEYLVEINDIKKTPDRETIWKQFAAKMGLDEKKLIIDKIITQAGSPIVQAYIKHYNNIESLKRIENKKNIERLEKLTKPKKENKEEQKNETSATEENKQENKE